MCWCNGFPALKTWIARVFQQSVRSDQIISYHIIPAISYQSYVKHTRSLVALVDFNPSSATKPLSSLGSLHVLKTSWRPTPTFHLRRRPHFLEDGLTCISLLMWRLLESQRYVKKISGLLAAEGAKMKHCHKNAPGSR